MIYGGNKKSYLLRQFRTVSRLKRIMRCWTVVAADEKNTKSRQDMGINTQTDDALNSSIFKRMCLDSELHFEQIERNVKISVTSSELDTPTNFLILRD